MLGKHVRFQTLLQIGGLVAWVVGLLWVSGCAATDSRVSPLASPQAKMPQSTLTLPTPRATLVSPVSPLSSPTSAPTRVISSTLRIAPDFRLQRENGQTLHLADMRGRSSVVLVFYRGQT